MVKHENNPNIKYQSKFHNQSINELEEDNQDENVKIQKTNIAVKTVNLRKASI